MIISANSVFLPFGHLREHTVTSVTDYRFTDQEYDSSSGLYNYDARLYDPVIQIGLVEALWFCKAGIQKIYDWLANLDFGKIRMGWIKQVIVFIRHNYARYS